MKKINLPVGVIGITQPTTLQKTARPINGVGCFLLRLNKGGKFMIMRKVFLALIIAAMTTLTALAQTRQSPDWTTPTGSWEGVVTAIDGPPPFRVLMNFTKDGGFTGSGDGDSAVGSPQYGVWERIGPKNSRTYALTFRMLRYNPDSTSTGMHKIQQTVILNESGDTWTGPGLVSIYDANGTLLFSGPATATASRIVSEPLP